MRIVFMGTPDFAVASLEALLAAGEHVVAVVTAPDKPAGRGRKLQQSAVKQFAVSRGLPVLQPVRLRDPEFIEELRKFQADLQVVVAFRMLPEVIWAMPEKGTINVHASLLPDYRGAAPINHVIINGESQTGVSTFILSHEIDTGNILFSQPVSIGETDTAGILHDRLMSAGSELLLRTVSALKTGQYQPIPQESLRSGLELREAPKIFKEDCEIDWNQETQVVYNLIRGLSPYPAAFTFIDGMMLKIFQAERCVQKHNHLMGSYHSDGKTFLKFATRDGYIDVLDLQIAGKKRMRTQDFLRGYRIGSDDQSSST